jgi:hypothetical protein
VEADLVAPIEIPEDLEEGSGTPAALGGMTVLKEQDTVPDVVAIYGLLSRIKNCRRPVPDRRSRPMKAGADVADRT